MEVASTLASELRLDIDGLRALRLPIDLLEAFPHWRSGSTRGFRPRSLGVTLVPDGAGQRLRALRLHLSPATTGTSLGITLLCELRRRLDPSVRLVVLVDPRADAAALRRAATDALGARARVRFVTADFNTIFARDNALAARDARGRGVLVVPRKLRSPIGGDSDPLDRRAVQRQLALRVVSSRFHWQGGNILFDGEAMAVGADTIAENVARLGLTADEVTHALAAELGREVVVLGDPAMGRLDEDRNRMSPSGQASYHIDLDVALLGRPGGSEKPVALVADGRGGLELLGSLIARDALPRPPYLTARRARARMAQEYRAAARAREPALQAYREALSARGYRVVGVPELRTRDLNEHGAGLQDLVYCNVLPGLNRRRAAVHYLPWGIPALDLAAERAYEEAGVHPVRVAPTSYLASVMMERAAGLRCFCGAMP